MASVRSLVALALLVPATAGAELRVASWGYQLQGTGGRPLDLGALERSPFDLLVIDAADQGKPLSRATVERLKRRRGEPRVVLAYLSVGEAEDYRPYWKPEWAKRPPPFLAAENSEWKGNYKVRYWHPEWRAILVQSLDAIIDAGFDGAYLDIIDAYEVFAGERPAAAREMAELVVALSEHARARAPRFVVVPQNGAGIRHDVPEQTFARYLAAIDGIGAEDSFFYGERAENNRLDVQEETVADLRQFVAARKVVLAVDYLTDAKKAKKFVELARKQGFVPYVGRRALDRLVVRQPR